MYCNSRWIGRGTRHASNLAGTTKISSSGTRRAQSSAYRISAWNPPLLFTEFCE